MKEISVKLSQRIIAFLQEQKGMEIKDIAKLAGTTPKYIAEVQEGTKPLKQSHIDKIQKEVDIFPAMATGLVSELIASKTKDGRGFVVEKTKQGQKLLRQSSNAVMQFICSMAADHIEEPAPKPRTKKK